MNKLPFSGLSRSAPGFAAVGLLLFSPPSLFASIPEIGLREVVINEVAWAGTRASPYDEWIELFNNSDRDIDLRGCVLEDRGTGQQLALQGTIRANSFYLLERYDPDLAGDADMTIRDIPASQLYSGFPLNNNGERLVLKYGDESGEVIVDSCNCDGGRWPGGDQTAKKTMERVSPGEEDGDGNWRSHDGIDSNGEDAEGYPIGGTPGAVNSACEICREFLAVDIQSPSDGETVYGASISVKGIFACGAGEAWRCEVMPNGNAPGTISREVAIGRLSPYISLSVWPNPVVIGQEAALRVEAYHPEMRAVYLYLHAQDERVILQENIYPPKKYVVWNWRFIPREPWERVLGVTIGWQGDNSFERMEKAFEFDVAASGPPQDARLDSFVGWMLSKGYSQEIIDHFRRQARHYLVRYQMDRLFDVRTGTASPDLERNQNIIKAFKGPGELRVAIHDLLDPSAAEIRPMDKSCPVMEESFRKLFGKDLRFDYLRHEKDYVREFGPLVQYGSNAGLATFGSDKYNRYLDNLLTDYGFDIFHQGVERIECDDGGVRSLLSTTGSYPCRSGYDIGVDSNALNLYAHEWAHDLGIYHHFLAVATHSSSPRYFSWKEIHWGLDCILSASYIASGTKSGEYLFCPLCRYAYEPADGYLDEETYAGEYNYQLSGSWLFTEDVPTHIPLAWLDPARPSGEEDLRLRHIEPFDRNGNPSPLIYRWYKNGLLQEGITGDVVDASLTDRPDLSGVEIWVNGIKAERNGFAFTCREIPVSEGGSPITATIKDVNLGLEEARTITVNVLPPPEPDAVSPPSVTVCSEGSEKIEVSGRRFESGDELVILSDGCSPALPAVTGTSFVDPTKLAGEVYVPPRVGAAGEFQVKVKRGEVFHPIDGPGAPFTVILSPPSPFSLDPDCLKPRLNSTVRISVSGNCFLPGTAGEPGDRLKVVDRANKNVASLKVTTRTGDLADAPSTYSRLVADIRFVSLSCVGTYYVKVERSGRLYGSLPLRISRISAVGSVSSP